MADQLYLNLWFPSFTEADMLPRLASVLRQFPFSAAKPGVGYVAVHGVAFAEPLVFSQTFEYQADTEDALKLAADFLHSDYAYELEALWDLWVPDKLHGDPDADPDAELDQIWILRPQPVRFLAHGTDFEDGMYQEAGHIQVDFGLDTPFLHEEFEFTPQIEERIKSNVQKLVAFVQAVEKNCGVTGRILWSESEENLAQNLAQKLIAKLQRVH